MGFAIIAEHLINRLDELVFERQLKITSVTHFLEYLDLSRSTIYRYFPGGIVDLYKHLVNKKISLLLKRNFESWQQLTECMIDYVQRNLSSVVWVYEQIAIPTFFIDTLKDLIISYHNFEQRTVVLIQERLDIMAESMFMQWQLWLTNYNDVSELTNHLLLIENVFNVNMEQ